MRKMIAESLGCRLTVLRPDTQIGPPPKMGTAQVGGGESFVNPRLSAQPFAAGDSPKP